MVVKVRNDSEFAQGLTVKYLTTLLAPRQALVNRASFSDRNSQRSLPELWCDSQPMNALARAMLFGKTVRMRGFIAAIRWLYEC
jgi:hypothetical protein